jgi:hypothetical protein
MSQTLKSLGLYFFATLSPALAAVTQVPAGANLQQYINAAQPGDTLVLQANATYIGNFTLPNNNGDSYITITSSDMASLPPAGVRVNPSYAQHMPKLVAPPGNWYASIVQSLPGAHHFAFVGIEFAPSPGQAIWNEVVLGDGSETALADLPHDFIFDRCYLHGNPGLDAKTGLVFNGSNMTAENNYISEFHSTWFDTAALGGWSGPGPFKIINNYLEAAGENLFWGGAAGSIPGVVPSDFEIQGNYLTKPWSWRQGDPSYAGIPYVVKNLMEFKVGKNITIEGNILENCWAMAQSGFAALFTTRTEGDTAPWFLIQNVIFRDNIIRHASAVFSLQGEDNLSGFTGSGSNFQAYNNLFYDINNQTYGGPYSPVALILNAFDNISITHNTALDMTMTIYMGGPPSPGFVAENNIFAGSQLGVVADGMNQAQTVFNSYSPNGIFTSNAVIGGNANYYTPGNFFPPTINDVGFVNPSAQNYALSSTSPYIAAATDGTALGANIAEINAATAGVIAGVAPVGSSSGSTAGSGSTGTGSTGTGSTGSGSTSGSGSNSGSGSSSAFTPILINAGGPAYTDAAGQKWSADAGYSGGLPWSVTSPITKTNDPALYQTCRYGDFSYNYAVPNGTYAVTLRFAEPTFSSAGARIFNVVINGAPVLQNFDIFAAAGGEFVALDKTFTVNVTTGQIAIQFISGPANSPMINAIAITAAPPLGSSGSSSSDFVPVHVNAGGGAYASASGQAWTADANYSGGYTWSVTNPIANTNDPALYQTCRYGNFSYNYAVPNGTYTVTLKFAEPTYSRVGARIFNVAINNAAALTNFDIFAAAGGEFIALDKTFTVNVTGGQISVQFSQGPADLPMVNAIAITAGAPPTNSSSNGSTSSSFTPIRVNAGGPAYTSSLGQSWSADTSYTGGQTWAVTNPISSTADQALYQTCRWGDFTYAFAVPNGSYVVNLKFAEPTYNRAGARIFNVAINGASVLSNFDIFAAAGGEFIAVDRSFPVIVTNGQINIRFSDGSIVDAPLVNAIEIVTAGN